MSLWLLGLLLGELVLAALFLYYCYQNFLQYLSETVGYICMGIATIVVGMLMYLTYTYFGGKNEPENMQPSTMSYVRHTSLTEKQLQAAINQLNDSSENRQDIEDKILSCFETPNQTIMVSESAQYKTLETAQSITSKPRKVKVNAYLAMLKSIQLNDSIYIKNIQFNQSKRVVYLELVELHRN